MNNNLINNNPYLTSIDVSSRNTTINSTGSSTTNHSHLKSVDEGTQSGFFEKFRGFVHKNPKLAFWAMSFLTVLSVSSLISVIPAVAVASSVTIAVLAVIGLAGLSFLCYKAAYFIAEGPW